MRLNKPKGVFSSQLVLLLVVVLFPLNKSQQNWTVAVSRSVLFSCNSDPHKMRIWEHDNNVLFNNKLKIDFKLDHIYLLDNYSLLIQEITLPHKGIYRCLQDGSIAAEFSLTVEVPPKMFLTINEFDNVTKISVEEGTDVTIFCHAVGALPPVNLSWTIDEEGKDYRAFNFTVGVGDEYHGRHVFNSVSAYTFKPFRNDGSVSCRSKTVSGVGNREINLQYSTFVSPDLGITLNSVSNKTELYVPIHKPSIVTCHAMGSRPVSNLFWYMNKLPINESGVANERIRRKKESFDTISSVVFTPQNTSGLITCVSKLSNNINYRKEISLNFYTYVIPEMYFTIDGKKWNNMSAINVTSNQVVTIICHADGARPKMELRWKLTTRTVDTNLVLTSNRDDQTFNITTSLQLPLNETERDVMCFTYGLYDHDVFILAHIQITGLPDTVVHTTTESYRKDTRSWEILVISLILLLITVPLVFAVRKHFGARSSQSVSHYNGNIDTNIASPLSGNNQKKLSRICALSVKNPLSRVVGTRFLNDIPRPIRAFTSQLDLPEVHGETDISEHCPAVSDDEYEPYFELKDKSSHYRIFQGKDMCLILSMNSGGHMQSRWMGTISLSNYHQKCAVFSTVSDITLKNRQIHWDKFVKRVLDLPDHYSLAKLEGVCVNQANLYLVHEHLTCDSLESIISSKRIANYTHGPFPTSEVASYLMDILRGMEVLHSFGFLHPGFSTKKVLVTDKGQCKLYSFLLSEDAPNKIRNMKSKKDCSITDLPPEALRRNEYSQASDMWCVAVVVWKLMTYDLIPVVPQNMDERGVCSVMQEWPASHLGLKNPVLFECWMYDDSFRPSVYKLRSSFEEVIRNLQAVSISGDTKESMTDLYISMDGIKTTPQHNSEMDRTRLSLDDE